MLWNIANFILSPNFFFMQRFTPISPTKSVMRYEVYRHKNANDEAFNLISDCLLYTSDAADERSGV